MLDVVAGARLACGARAHQERWRDRPDEAAATQDHGCQCLIDEVPERRCRWRCSLSAPEDDDGRNGHHGQHGDAHVGAGDGVSTLPGALAGRPVVGRRGNASTRERPSPRRSNLPDSRARARTVLRGPDPDHLHHHDPAQRRRPGHGRRPGRGDPRRRDRRGHDLARGRDLAWGAGRPLSGMPCDWAGTSGPSILTAVPTPERRRSIPDPGARRSPPHPERVAHPVRHHCDL